MKYKLIRKGNRIIVDHVTWLGLAPVRLIHEIDEWVTTAGIGFRIAYSTWRLVDEASVTLFILRWDNNA